MTNVSAIHHHLFCDVTQTRDETQVWLRRAGIVGDTMSIASYGIKVGFDGATVALQCESDGDADVVEVSQVRITAMRVPTATVSLIRADGEGSNSWAPVQLWYRDAQQNADKLWFQTTLPEWQLAHHREAAGDQLLIRPGGVPSVLGDDSASLVPGLGENRFRPCCGCGVPDRPARLGTSDGAPGSAGTNPVARRRLVAIGAT